MGMGWVWDGYGMNCSYSTTIPGGGWSDQTKSILNSTQVELKLELEFGNIYKSTFDRQIFKGVYFFNFKCDMLTLATRYMALFLP